MLACDVWAFSRLSDHLGDGKIVSLVVQAQKSEKEREERAQKMKADAKAKQLQVEKDAAIKRLEAAKKQEEKLVRQDLRKKEKAAIQAEKTRAAQIRIEAVLEADKRNIQQKHERAEQKKVYLAERMKENERIAALEQLKRDEEAAVKAAKVMIAPCSAAGVLIP